MTVGTGLVQLLLTFGAVVATAIAAARILLLAKRKQNTVRVQIGDEKWVFDPALVSPSEVDELLRRLTFAIKSVSETQARDLAVVLRLPRFDKTVQQVASSPSGQRPRRVIADGGFRYVLIDSRHDRLEILVESASDSVSGALLPVTVVTPDGATSYLLLFRREPSGIWAADIEVPGFRTWANVVVHETREVASLDADDVMVVARSVQAASDSSVPVWQEIAKSRTEGDPVRAAIASVVVLPSED